jgi:hypothetical protein
VRPCGTFTCQRLADPRNQHRLRRLERLALLNRTPRPDRSAALAFALGLLDASG